MFCTDQRSNFDGDYLLRDTWPRLRYFHQSWAEREECLEMVSWFATSSNLKELLATLSMSWTMLWQSCSMESTSSSALTISVFPTSTLKNRPKISLPTMILRIRFLKQEGPRNQLNSISEQRQVEVPTVSRPCQGDLKEALGANKLFAGQDLDRLHKRRVAGTMSRPQRMKSLETKRTTRQVTIQYPSPPLPSQHHLTSIHMTLVHLNSLWLGKRLSDSSFLVSNKTNQTLIKPKRLASNSAASNAKIHLLSKKNLPASSRVHTIATVEILSLINPIINLRHSLRRNLLKDQLDCIRDRHQWCSKQNKRRRSNFSNSIWEKSRNV